MRICWLAALLALPAFGQSFPTLEAENLLGKKVQVPALMAGQKAILVIGFTHASQHQTQSWARSLEHSPYPVFSMAVLEDAPRLVRGMAVHGIKSGVPKDRYDRFLVVYHGEKELRQAAGFEQPDDAYVLVLAADGAIRWKIHGAATAEAVRTALEQAARP